MFIFAIKVSQKYIDDELKSAESLVSDLAKKSNEGKTNRINLSTPPDQKKEKEQVQLITLTKGVIPCDLGNLEAVLEYIEELHAIKRRLQGSW